MDLGQSDVFCSRALGATAFGVFHALAFAQGLERRAFDGRVVEEQLTPFTFDEPKAFVGNQLLDRACWHTLSTPQKKMETDVRHTIAEPPVRNRDKRRMGREYQVNRDRRNIRGKLSEDN